MNYVGSKQRLAKDIIPIINTFLGGDNVFIDACCGGCNIVANPKHEINAKKKIAFDNNKYLVALLNKFKIDKPEPLNITKEEYKNVLLNKNNYEDWYVGYVGFLTTYRNVFFGGFADKFDHRNKEIESYNNLSRQDISQIIIECRDLFSVSANDAVIYIDPPYKGTKKYYTCFDYDKFWDKARELSKNNIVLVSEQTIPDDVNILFSKPLKMMMKNNNDYVSRMEYLVKVG